MLTRNQHEIMAQFIADHNGGDADDYIGDADATRDDFHNFDGRHWREAGGRDNDPVAGFPAVHYDAVQVRKGMERVALWVVDFGDVRGIYQM